MLLARMASPEQPLVSVLTPTRDVARFVAETIESVLGQTYPRVEHVFSDGGSTDGTVEIIEQYARDHPGRIRLLQGDPRTGPWRRRNEAFLASEGSLICWLDADDLWAPEKTERQVELLLARPELGFVYSYFEAFDSSSGKTLVWEDATRDWEGDIFAPLWVKGCFLAAQTMMMRRSAIDERVLRLGDEGVQFGDDYWLLLGLAIGSQAARIDEVLTRYRRHDRNQSSVFHEWNSTANLVEVMKDFLTAFPEAHPKLGRWRRIGLARNWTLAAAFERRRGNRALATRYLLRALRCDPRGLYAEPRLDRMLQEQLGSGRD